MVQYFENGDLACFDGLSFRRDKRTGYFLNAKTHKRLHVYVWEYYNGGEVWNGYLIHPKDNEKNKNEIENLVFLLVHCPLYTFSIPRDRPRDRMPSSA